MSVNIRITDPDPTQPATQTIGAHGIDFTEKFIEEFHLRPVLESIALEIAVQKAENPANLEIKGIVFHDLTFSYIYN